MNSLSCKVFSLVLLGLWAFSLPGTPPAVHELVMAVPAQVLRDPDLPH